MTHWSTRLLADELGIGDATVARAWRRYGVQPWRRETFKFSTDPELEAKVRDVVGLYLDPPEKAIVLCVDEKSPDPGAGPDRADPAAAARAAGEATHDYKRNGTTTLFAALEVATGKVTDACYDRHGKAEFLDFLKQVAKAYPRRELHVVLDNYHTHKHAEISAWLAKNPRITLHFTPTSGSWLNLVEVFFGIITRQAIRRGTFASVKELVAAIREFIDGWNDRCHPFTWTKTADEILPHATRQTNFRRATLGAAHVLGGIGARRVLGRRRQLGAAEVSGKDQRTPAAHDDRKQIGEHPEHEDRRHDGRLVLPVRGHQQRRDVQGLGDPDAARSDLDHRRQAHDRVDREHLVERQDIAIHPERPQ